MIRSSQLENKDAASRETLIARLLDSPLAAELQRSLTEGYEPARARAAALLHELETKHAARHAQLSATARELIDKRDALAKQYEVAKAAAEVASDRATSERDSFAMKRAELQRLTTARASYLTGAGLTSAEAVARLVASWK